MVRLEVYIRLYSRTIAMPHTMLFISSTCCCGEIKLESDRVVFSYGALIHCN